MNTQKTGVVIHAQYVRRDNSLFIGLNINHQDKQNSFHIPLSRPYN